jgi:hypothetical protein
MKVSGGSSYVATKKINTTLPTSSHLIPSIHEQLDLHFIKPPKRISVRSDRWQMGPSGITVLEAGSNITSNNHTRNTSRDLAHQLA